MSIHTLLLEVVPSWDELLMEVDLCNGNDYDCAFNTESNVCAPRAGKKIKHDVCDSCTHVCDERSNLKKNVMAYVD